MPVYSDPIPPYMRELGKYDWDGDIAYAVMRAESLSNPEAYNPEWHKGCQGSTGLFQIACVHGYSYEELKDPIRNIEVAYKIYSGSERGWKQWGSYTDFRYLDFMVK